MARSQSLTLAEHYSKMTCICYPQARELNIQYQKGGGHVGCHSFICHRSPRALIFRKKLSIDTDILFCSGQRWGPHHPLSQRWRCKDCRGDGPVGSSYNQCARFRRLCVLAHPGIRTGLSSRIERIIRPPRRSWTISSLFSRASVG